MICRFSEWFHLSVPGKNDCKKFAFDLWVKGLDNDIKLDFLLTRNVFLFDVRIIGDIS